MGDATMDDETQPMHPDDADESPLHSVKTGPTELALANEDVRARSDALRDAARAAAAASEASKDRLVIPLAPMNPYQQAALEVPTGNTGGRKEGKGPKDRLESPEKKLIVQGDWDPRPSLGVACHQAQLRFLKNSPHDLQGLLSSIT